MTFPVYPGASLIRGKTYSSKWSPTFFNQRATSAAGAELVVGLAQYPLHDFELTYSFLRDGPRWGQALAALEFKTMMGFHLQMGGSLGRFLFRNPDDHEVFQNIIGVGDGVTRTFTLTRTFGANGYFATEPVGQIDLASPVNVYLNGSATPQPNGAYTIDNSAPCANTITFLVAPPNGQAVAIDMVYYYYCMLSQDNNTFEKFMDRLWMLSQVTLHSCRPGA